MRVEGAHPVDGQLPRGLRRSSSRASATPISQSPLHDVLGHDGDPVERRVLRPDRARRDPLYTAAVLRQMPEEPLQPVPMGDVYLADDADVAIALRMDGYLKDGVAHRRFRSACIAPAATDAPIYLDADFLHRTRSRAPEHHRRLGSRDEDERGRVAAAVDLRALSGAEGIDRGGVLQREGTRTSASSTSPASSTTRTARSIAQCDVPAEPFRDVQYFAPYKSDGFSLNTLRSQRGAARTTSARSPGGCARCCSTPRCCSTRTTSTRRPTR